MVVCEGPLGPEQADKANHGDIAQPVCLLHSQLEVAAPVGPQHAGASERQEDPQWRLPQASVPFGPLGPAGRGM
eukprot:9932296-Prorocentrum_lima.AAC.1